MKRLRAVWTAAAIAAAAGQAMGLDLGPLGSEPLRFAVETLSGEAVTLAARGAEGGRYYNVRAPEHTALASTTKIPLSARDGWYLRVDLDGMVFSDTPVLATAGGGAGSGFESTGGDVVAGGAREAFVVYRLPDDEGFSRGLTFRLSIDDALAVPDGEGAYGAAMALYDDLGGAFDREDPLRYSAFGGEATVVVLTSGLDIAIESGFAAANFEDGLEGFVAAAASGESADPDNPSAPAVLGSISVGAREAAAPGRVPVYAARSGLAVTAADVIESVAVTVEGDMRFGTLDLRTGTEHDRCLRRSPATATSPDGGVLPLSPPVGEETVTTVGMATLRHEEAAWGTRNLCVWLPERAADETPVRIPIVFYEATVTVTPPFGGAVERQGTVGVIGRLGARVDMATLTTSERYDQVIVIVNSGFAAARYAFDTFSPPAGVEVALSPAADGGLNAIAPQSTVVLAVAETLRLTGPENALTAATLWFDADADNIDLAVVQTNRSDGSTDTVVYEARPSVRPEDAL